MDAKKTSEWKKVVSDGGPTGYGHVYYHTKAKPENQISSEIPFTVDVRWPDGAIVPQCRVFQVPENYENYDHGHTYQCQRTNLEIRDLLHGILVSRDLTEVEINPGTLKVLGKEG